jgi:hypothetical protein
MPTSASCLSMAHAPRGGKSIAHIVSAVSAMRPRRQLVRSSFSPLPPQDASPSEEASEEFRAARGSRDFIWRGGRGETIKRLQARSEFVPYLLSAKKPDVVTIFLWRHLDASVQRFIRLSKLELRGSFYMRRGFDAIRHAHLCLDRHAIVAQGNGGMTMHAIKSNRIAQ